MTKRKRKQSGTDFVVDEFAKIREQERRKAEKEKETKA